MPNVHIKFATEILIRLGEELSPNPDQSILELVKNAYDADAQKCLVIITPGSKSEICIVDNGDGMSAKTIEQSFLLVGRSNKSVEKLTRLGRHPSGNKGLGRLAALRLGRKVSILSNPRRNASEAENRLEIDWSRFDKASSVEEVNLEILTSKKKERNRFGTIIRLQNIRSPLTETEIRRIARGLLLLADPFNDTKAGFKPILRSPSYKQLEQMVRRRYFDQADFHLVAQIDEKGRGSAKVFDYRGKVLFRASHEDLISRNLKTSYDCPPLQFDLWTFTLDAANFSAKDATISEVKAWLAEFGGIHFYVRNLRVPPYGNPGDDWVEMNLLRQRSPDLRPGTNTSIGRIKLDDLAETLIPKTDRSGFVENEALEEIRSFAKDSLNWFARRRVFERDRISQIERNKTKVEAEKASLKLDRILSKIPQKQKVQVKNEIDTLFRTKDQRANQLLKQVQLYRLLGTAGISSTVFAHESKHSTDLIKRNVVILERCWQAYSEIDPPEDFLDAVGRIKDNVAALQTFGGLTLSFINRQKRRIGRVDIHEVISHVIKLFRPLLKEKKISVVTSFAKGSAYIRSTETLFESIIANLVVNSIKAFVNVRPGDWKIDITTTLQNSDLIIAVNDNGPGIKGISVREVWLPGETTYNDGTGLGLTIVRDSIEEIGGRVSAKANGKLGGAEFNLIIPIIGDSK